MRDAACRVVTPYKTFEPDKGRGGRQSIRPCGEPPFTQGRPYICRCGARVSTPAFQAGNAGSSPVSGSSSVVNGTSYNKLRAVKAAPYAHRRRCKSGWRATEEGVLSSVGYAPLAQWQSRPLITARVRVRVPEGAPPAKAGHLIILGNPERRMGIAATLYADRAVRRFHRGPDEDQTFCGAYIYKSKYACARILIGPLRA